MVMIRGSADSKQKINERETQSWMIDEAKQERREAERDGRGGLAEDAELTQKRAVVKDGRSEREGRKISSPGGIISHLSH